MKPFAVRCALPLILSTFALACAEQKAPTLAPDFGAEDAQQGAYKDDSATAPGRTEAIRLGEIKTATLTARTQFVAFVFQGVRDQRVDLLLDGLRGLDTILYLYKVSGLTGRPFGTPLAQNDDTARADWTVRTNTRPNALSSNVLNVRLPETRRYALVATTYRNAGLGSAEALDRAAGQAAPIDVTLAELRSNGARYSGRVVRVAATVGVGVSMCTKIGCPQTNPCCNQCAAQFAIDGDVKLFGANGVNYGCTGNECSLGTCTGFPSAQPGRYELVGKYLQSGAGERSLTLQSMRALDCTRGGCSGQLCSNGPGGISTCEFRPEYACYRTATCAAQPEGHCGWTMTNTLRACLANPPRN